MLEELKKLQEKMNKAREEAFEKYEKMYDEYCEKILEFLPYMDKIIENNQVTIMGEVVDVILSITCY